MNNVTSLNEIKSQKMLGDFQKQKVSFNLRKLQHALNEVLKIKGFDTSLGIPHFAAIPLTQIPGDPSSIEGNKARGVYWTKPDSTGIEVSRDVNIDESKYSEFIKDFEHTYFKEVFNELKKYYKLGRLGLGAARGVTPPHSRGSCWAGLKLPTGNIAHQNPHRWRKRLLGNA